jgi:hypothetical protein
MLLIYYMVRFIQTLDNYSVLSRQSSHTKKTEKVERWITPGVGS